MCTHSQSAQHLAAGLASESMALISNNSIDMQGLTSSYPIKMLLLMPLSYNAFCTQSHNFSPCKVLNQEYNTCH